MSEKEPTKKVAKKKLDQIPTLTKGVIYSPADVRDYRPVAAAAPIDFPEEFVLPMVRVKNQGQVSSCVAHSLSEVVEYFNKKQHNISYVMSTDFIYGNRRTSDHTGEGMVVRDALKALQKYGDVRESKFSGNTEVPDVIEKFESNVDALKDEAYKSRISTYVRLKTVNEVKAFLMKHGPVVMAMTWYSDFKVEPDGSLVSNFDKNDSLGGHCMVIIGWNKQGWIIQNSWSKSWGQNGTCFFNTEWTDRIREMWGVTDEILENPDDPESNTDIETPLNSEFGKIIARILNWILNLFKVKN